MAPGLAYRVTACALDQQARIISNPSKYFGFEGINSDLRRVGMVSNGVQGRRGKGSPMILALLVSTAQIADAAARTETANRPTPSVVVVPPATSTESTNYVLARPRVRVRDDALRVDGTVCRKSNRTGLTPSKVRIEHLDASGTITETVSAFLPPLSRRQDQRCGHYGANLKTANPGDTVRVCIARRSCAAS